MSHICHDRTIERDIKLKNFILLTNYKMNNINKQRTQLEKDPVKETRKTKNKETAELLDIDPNILKLIP
jgi:hypothetical protein